jgi:hypothetical protein
LIESFSCSISIRAQGTGALTEREELVDGIFQEGRNLAIQVLLRRARDPRVFEVDFKNCCKAAEQQRRGELEAGFHNLKEVRQQRIRRLNEVVDEYLVGYCLRYRSATFAKYALGHVSRLLGAEMIVDIDEAPVLRYQEDRLEDRLREKAASKSINEEVRFLLKMLGDSGEVIRGRLRKKKQLKLAVRKNMGKAFDGGMGRFPVTLQGAVAPYLGQRIGDRGVHSRQRIPAQVQRVAMGQGRVQLALCCPCGRRSTPERLGRSTAPLVLARARASHARRKRRSART